MVFLPWRGIRTAGKPVAPDERYSLAILGGHRRPGSLACLLCHGDESTAFVATFAQEAGRLRAEHPSAWRFLETDPLVMSWITHMVNARQTRESPPQFWKTLSRQRTRGTDPWCTISEDMLPPLSGETSGSPGF